MTELYRFRLEDPDGNGSVVVEVSEAPGVKPAARRDGVVRDAKLTFEQALAGVRDAASSALGQFREMAERPDEVEITFGVKLEASLGAVIAQAGAQGNIEVKLRWRREKGTGTLD